MLSNALATLSLIEDQLENAKSDDPVEPCFRPEQSTEEVDAEFVTPMADTILA